MRNRTDKITFSSSSNKYIDYTYDANGSLIRKRQYDNVGGVATLQNTTDYIDGFVFVNSTLSYFPMPEGRVVNNSGTLVQEFIITDQQGNARVSFQNNGSGVAVVKQETSYYGFGMQLANSPVTPPSIPNKQLYNGGSEWQNDYTGNLPDYQQTFYRNYDAALGRFIGVDPAAESAESMTGYQYAGNNPILFNDPMGDKPIPATEYWAPSNALRNGVLDHLNANMEAFFGASDVAATAAAAAGDNDVTGGGTSVYGSVFMGVNDELRDQYHNDFIHNSVAYDASSRGSSSGVALYVYEDGHTEIEKGSKYSYIVNQLDNQGHYSWSFNQIGNQQGAWEGDGPPTKHSNNTTLWPHLIGPGLIGLGQPINYLKPIGMLGSKAGSSIASFTLRKIVPGTLKGMLGETVGGALVRMAGTNGLGAALGRFVPVVGVAWTLGDLQSWGFHYTLDHAPNNQVREEMLTGYSLGL